MLYLTALLMGLAGGPHCVAMCGAACGALTRSPRAAWQFQAGRLTGYALAGALVASTAQGLAWAAQQSKALQMLWTFFHLAVLLWGLLLVAYARQPAWASRFAKVAWMQIKPLALSRGGAFFSGLLWTALPCGLLYSGLLLASLANNAGQGAGVMALFGLASGVWLSAAPSLWKNLRLRLNSSLATRLSGALLCVAAAWALWMDVARQVALCQ